MSDPSTLSEKAACANGSAGDAIDYALGHIDEPEERSDFLDAWREGAVAEWPDYARWLEVQYRDRTRPTPQADNALVEALEALAKQALRESPAPWETDTEKSEGEYGAGPDTSTGFNVSLLLDAKGRSLFDALNSTATIVHEDYPDEYGDVAAWDETSRANAALIVALVNNLPTILTALRAGMAISSPVDADDGVDGPTGDPELFAPKLWAEAKACVASGWHQPWLSDLHHVPGNALGKCCFDRLFGAPVDAMGAEGVEVDRKAGDRLWMEMTGDWPKDLCDEDAETLALLVRSLARHRRAHPPKAEAEIELLREAREELCEYATHEEFDYPSEAPVSCGIWCDICHETVADDHSDHRADCIISRIAALSSTDQGEG